MKKKIIFLIALIILLGIINYFLLVPLNLRYTSIFTIFIILVILIIFLFSKKMYTKKYISAGNILIGTTLPTKTVGIIFISAFVLIILHASSSTPIIFSKQYKELIGDVEEKDFLEEFDIIENDKIPIVDKAYAEKLGDKKIGSERGLGSEYHVGEFSDIVVDGKMVMVAPLEFNGFFKWLNHKYTPGYIVVDKITGEVKLVQEVNGKKLKLKYIESAYLNDDLKRKVYYNGNMDNWLYQTTFELDDDMNPYFVVTKTKKTIGINGGDDVKSVVLINAVTGKVKEYKPNKAPEWVDTRYPSNLVVKQVDDWGLYVNGFLNTLFSEKEVIRVTSGSRMVYNDNNLYTYTGLTSSKSDESSVGFAFVNSKTKQTTFYKITGATEEAAMNSAEGKVENYGYQAAFPLPLNIENTPTFLVTLKDNSGLIKQYAFVNIEDFSIVGNGENINSALSKYTKSLNKEYIPNQKEEEEIEGIIQRIGLESTENGSTYYIKLKEKEDIYQADSSISKELSLTRENDKIKMTIVKTKIMSFDNNEV